MSKRRTQDRQRKVITSQIRLPGLMHHTTFQAAVVLAMGLIIAFVIVYESKETAGPRIEIEIGEVASQDILATHDLAVVEMDTSDLELRRATAEQNVLPVWDYYGDVVHTVSGRIDQAFDTMRGELKDFADARWEPPVVYDDDTSEGTGASVPGGGSGPSAPAQPQPQPTENGPADPVERLTRADIEEFIGLHRNSLTSQLRASISPSAAAALARDTFSTRAADAIKDLVNPILSEPIVDSLPVLQAEERGITLRRWRNQRVVREEELHDFSDFLDPEGAAELVRERVRDIPPEELSGELKEAVVDTTIALLRVSVNTLYHDLETAARIRSARAAVRPSTTTRAIHAGDVIVRAGDTVTESTHGIIQLMQSVAAGSGRSRTNELVIGGVIYVLIILVGIMAYAVRFIRRFNPNLRDMAFMFVTLVVMVAMTRGAIVLADWIANLSPAVPRVGLYALIPFAAGAMLTRVVLNAESALIFAITFSLLVAVMLPEYPIFAAFALIGSLAGTGAIEVVNTRMSLFRGGLLVGFVNVAFAVALGLLSSQFLTVTTLQVAGLALSGGVLVAILVTALLPVVENTFKYISDFKLLELANPNHPALRDLMLHAPGSYHHSMMVATLAASACKEIGAHALLARVGSYYHDIGKTKNPQYFAENISGKNPHDKLKPHMSALIIKSHVKDGVDMALSYGLPGEIIRFIREHHGTNLIKFFYHKAKEQEDPGIQQVDEKHFRYPGPRPQTPETAVCMLADGIEAASRAMQDPTPARLQGLVQHMINDAFTEGQLDESDLTLRDLDAVARVFIRILISIYHQRPEYPDVKRESVNMRAKTVEIEEADDGSGDSSASDDQAEATETESTETRSTGTLRRLGIDKGGTVDSANRRQRDKSA